ncbi:hypothetical protein ACSBR2_033567 [Camellia fascicularis]
MVLLLTLPGVDCLRKGLIAVTRNLLKPFLSVVPFCLFLLMDIYCKYETRPSCELPDSCTLTEHLRHEKSIMKSQGHVNPWSLTPFATIAYQHPLKTLHLGLGFREWRKKTKKRKREGTPVDGNRRGGVRWRGATTGDGANSENFSASLFRNVKHAILFIYHKGPYSPSNPRLKVNTEHRKFQIENKITQY